MSSVTYRKVKALLRKNYFRQIPICPSEKLKFHRITLGTDGVLTIEKGYAWDHASGAFDTDNIIEAALVHDALSELIHNNHLPKSTWYAAADVMYAIMVEHGMWRFRASWIRRAILIAGPGVTKSRIWKTIPNGK